MNIVTIDLLNGLFPTKLFGNSDNEIPEAYVQAALDRLQVLINDPINARYTALLQKLKKDIKDSGKQIRANTNCDCDRSKCEEVRCAITERYDSKQRYYSIGYINSVVNYAVNMFDSY
jgi:hypothetical protein